MLNLNKFIKNLSFVQVGFFFFFVQEHPPSIKNELKILFVCQLYSHCLQDFMFARIEKKKSFQLYTLYVIIFYTNDFSTAEKHRMLVYNFQNDSG